MFDIGTGVAILIDATLIRGVLVPSLTGRRGRRQLVVAGPLRRLHRHIGISEPPATAEATRLQVVPSSNP
jgi:RND superfamily putative drug exporter